MQPASISSRLAAMNLDMLFFGVLWQALNTALHSLAPELAIPEVLVPASVLCSILYFIYPTKFGGQTLGKKLLSIQVVSQYNSKARLTWGQVLKREVLGKILSSLPLGLGYLWAIFKSDRKSWHDSLSDTQVISLIWEEEKTSAQKLQQIVLAVISVPAGVALIVGVFLYTSLPLNSIKEKLEASGIQVGSLSGSLGMGLRFTEIRRQDPEPRFELSTVEVKFNLWSLVTQDAFYIEKITAEQGRVEVPEDFSLQVIFSNLLAMIQSSEKESQKPTPLIHNFTLGKVHFKNIIFENNKKTLSHLQEFSLKSLALVSEEFFVAEVQMQVDGFKFKATELKSSFGNIEIGNIVGGIAPEYLPLLKVPVDFNVKGVLGKKSKVTKLNAGLMIDKIKVNYETEKLTAFVDKLVLNEMFKTSVPIEELDLKLSTQGKNLMEMFGAIDVEYRAKICGQEFLPESGRGAVLRRADREFGFRISPLPVLDVAQVAFSPQATLEELFSFQLYEKKGSAAPYGTPQEMLAHLCFQRGVAQLQPLELEVVVALEKIVSLGGEPPASSLQPSPHSLHSQAEESTMPDGEAAVESKTELKPGELKTVESKTGEPPTAEPTPQKEHTPSEAMRSAFAEAKSLLKQGKIPEAKSRIEGVPVTAEGFSPEELGSYHNLKAWLYLYSNELQSAVENFEKAFSARKDIADAEGLLRAHEALKKDQEARKWLDYIKTAIKENPELKNQLTQNMQRKLATEASEESHP